MGFTIALVGSQPMRVAGLALYKYYERLRSHGVGAVTAAGEDMIGSPFEDWHGLTGYDEISALEDRYLPPDQVRDRSQSQPGYYGRHHSK
jgi:hypothetical protein